jgi:hypothetical protein
VHILVAVRVAVPVVMPMRMAMVKGHDPDEIDQQTCYTDGEKFSESMHLTTRGKPFHCFVDDLNADYPVYS